MIASFFILNLISSLIMYFKRKLKSFYGKINNNDKILRRVSFVERVKKFIKNNCLEIIYLIILTIIIILSRSSDKSILIFRGLLISCMWVIPYFLNIRFKVINTGILSISIIYITSRFFSSSRIDASNIAIILILMLFITLVINIFLVIKDMYQLKEKSGKLRNGLKLIYVLSAFLLLIGTVIISYSHIYDNIQFYNSSSFTIGSGGVFSGIYYSSTTFFTVGYGDITPMSSLARAISISQMVFGYLITCLIIPTILVAFQKLFVSED